MINLEKKVEGPFSTVYYDVTLDDGTRMKVTGKRASLISLLLSGYLMRPDFHPFDAFTEESLDIGRVKERNSDEGSAYQG